MSDTAKTAATNAVVSAAQDVPSLIAGLKQVDPAMADALTSKPLAASKTPWGTLAVAAVVWLSARFGLGWDEATCALVGGVGVLAGSYAMRYITASPIAGILSKPQGSNP